MSYRHRGHARPGASALFALLAALPFAAFALSSCGAHTLVTGPAAEQTATAIAQQDLPTTTLAPTSPPTLTPEVHCPKPEMIPPDASVLAPKYRGRHCPDLILAEWSDQRGFRQGWVARASLNLSDDAYNALPLADPSGAVPGVGAASQIGGPAWAL